jgi:signal transduction histidine kinase
MSQLIDDLLRLSQVTRAPLRREAVDVSSLALELVEGLREADPARTLQVVVQPGLAARGDRTLLRAALQNLLGNAWKFTRQQPEARIEVGGGVRDGLPVFWVRDNGAGFDMTFVGKLFAPFQRLHSRSEFEGTGIGLATVARIVRRHGGRVWAEGAPGAGASFYFTLRDDAADEKEVECATA